MNETASVVAAGKAEEAMTALIEAVDEYVVEGLRGRANRDVQRWVIGRLREGLGSACPKFRQRTGARLSLTEMAERYV